MVLEKKPATAMVAWLQLQVGVHAKEAPSFPIWIEFQLFHAVYFADHPSCVLFLFWQSCLAVSHPSLRSEGGKHQVLVFTVLLPITWHLRHEAQGL